jgi:hypothetical protein
MEGRRSVRQSLHLVRKHHPDLPSVCHETVSKAREAQASLEPRVVCLGILGARRAASSGPRHPAAAAPQTPLSTPQPGETRSDHGHDTHCRAPF